MKKQIQALEYASQILQAVKTGALLTTKADNFVNTMTIGWGGLGIEWGIPIFAAFVRHGRYTREMLDKNPEFTINIPLGGELELAKNILAVCGKKSGRDCDKIKELSLGLVDGECVSAPAIKQFPMTLECKVVYRQAQDPNNIPAQLKARYYPQDVDSANPLENKDFHIAYYGEIVRAYIIEEKINE